MKKRLTSLITMCLVFGLGFSSVSAHTPPGLAKKGGLPPGIQKRFIQQEKDTKEYQTTIKDIDTKERRIVIEDGTAILSLLVSNKAKIELNKKSAKFEDIRKNDEVFIKLDKDNTITELKATREKETIYTVEGKLLLVSEDQDQIYIYKDNKLLNYQLKSDVIVKINGEKRKISDLIQGMELELTIEGNKVKLIEGSKDEETRRLEGKIIAKDDGRRPLIVIQIDNDIKVFSVEEDVNMDEVKVGKEAVIYIKDNEVINIRMK